MRRVAGCFGRAWQVCVCVSAQERGAIPESFAPHVTWASGCALVYSFDGMMACDMKTAGVASDGGSQLHARAAFNARGGKGLAQVTRQQVAPTEKGNPLEFYVEIPYRMFVVCAPDCAQGTIYINTAKN